MKPEFLVERNGKRFVLYAGLLDLAHERGLSGITTTLIQIPSDLNGRMAIVHASVETKQGTFSGLGDADATNVSRMMVPHLIRMAETRAKARALRDAVNVGVTALEELGDVDDAPGGARSLTPEPARRSLPADTGEAGGPDDDDPFAGDPGFRMQGTQKPQPQLERARQALAAHAAETKAPAAPPAAPGAAAQAGWITPTQKAAITRLHEKLGMAPPTEQSLSLMDSKAAGKRIIALDKQIKEQRG